MSETEKPNAAWIIVANLIPVAGIMLLGWQALPLLVFYWLENLVIGVINLMKIAAAAIGKPLENLILALILVPFFVLHYGLFCLVHGVFVFAIFAFGDAWNEGAAPKGDPFDLLSSIWQMLAADLEFAISIVLTILIQIVIFIVDWIIPRKWQTVNPLEQMFEPYGRIVVMHLTIFIAAIPVILLNQPMIAVLALAVLKAGLELHLPFFRVATPDLSKLRPKSIE